jgi:hypothetical protein
MVVVIDGLVVHGRADGADHRVGRIFSHGKWSRLLRAAEVRATASRTTAASVVPRRAAW